MPDHVLTQVEDRIVEVLAAWPPLSAGLAIGVLESADIAIEDMDIVVATAGYSFEVADENWQTLHTALVEIATIARGPQASGSISRTNRNTLAHAHAAIAADRTLGIGLQDIQEVDIAPAEGRGKDVDSASVQYRVQWFTARDDWFTIAQP